MRGCEMSEAGIRLYFKCFSTNYFNSTITKHIMAGVRLKNQLKSDCLAQITGKYQPINFINCPIIMDFTFLSTHNYDVDNYLTMSKYVQDCLVLRGVLQDDNPKIVNETRIRVINVKSYADEGVFIRFISNKTPEIPNFEI
jgi:Holliday junction resolvase RusA-like endonuclease